MADKIPMVTIWMGQDITKMPRDELERAFVTLGQMFNDAVSSCIKELDVLQIRRRDG